jgi:hypothetical protein
MATRIEEVPFLAQRADKIEARLYNLWQRLRQRRQAKRLHGPFRVPLEGLSGLELIVDEQSWVCVDVRQYDLPILAWLDFEDARRDALHLPIPCKINYYHFAASRLRGKVLDLLAHELEQRLK